MKEKGQVKWKVVYEENINNVELKDVKANTAYVFRVRVVYPDTDEEGPYSPLSNEITTKESPAHKLISWSVEKKDTSHPKIYTIPVTELQCSRNEAARTRKLEIGECFISLNY